MGMAALLRIVAAVLLRVLAVPHSREGPCHLSTRGLPQTRFTARWGKKARSTASVGLSYRLQKLPPPACLRTNW